MSDSTYNPYGYTPNAGVNMAAAVLFGISLVTCTLLSIWYRQRWFGTAFFIGFILETSGYVARYLSNSDPTKIGHYTQQSSSLTLAPALFMAGVYYLLAKFTVIYRPGVSRIKPLWYSYIFVSCDLLSIAIQGAGGGIAASASKDKSGSSLGVNVMIVGLAVQVFTMVLFIIFCIDFMMRVRRHKNDLNNDDIYTPEYAHIPRSRMFVPLLWAIATCTTLILARCIFRLIELSGGWDSSLMHNQVCFMIMEALVVWVGTSALAFIHPGLLFKRCRIRVKNVNNKITEGRSVFEMENSGVFSTSEGDNLLNGSKTGNIQSSAKSQV